MKWILLIATVVSLTSCNTMIGVWRDTKAGFNWSKEKIQNSGNGGSQQEYGAPVY
jgi:predicted small secreted protein